MFGNNQKVLTDALYDAVEENGETNVLSLIHPDVNSESVGNSDFIDYDNEITWHVPPDIPKEDYTGSIMDYLIPPLISKENNFACDVDYSSPAHIHKENNVDCDIDSFPPPQIHEENNVDCNIDSFSPPQIHKESNVDWDIDPFPPPQIHKENNIDWDINPFSPPQIHNENNDDWDFYPFSPPQIHKENNAASDIYPLLPPQIPKENNFCTDINSLSPPQILIENNATSDIYPLLPPQIPKENNFCTDINSPSPPQILIENNATSDIYPLLPPQIPKENYAWSDIDPLSPSEIPEENHVGSDIDPLSPLQIPEENHVGSDIDPLFPLQIPNENPVGSDIDPLFLSQIPEENNALTYNDPIFPDFSRYDIEKCDSTFPFARLACDKDNNLFPSSPSSKGTSISDSSEFENIPNTCILCHDDTETPNVSPPNLIAENESDGNTDSLSASETGIDCLAAENESDGNTGSLSASETGIDCLAAENESDGNTGSLSASETGINCLAAENEIDGNTGSLSASETGIACLASENESDGKTDSLSTSETGIDCRGDYFYVENEEIHYTSLPFAAILKGHLLIGIRANHAVNSFDDLESYLTDCQIKTPLPYSTAKYIEEDKPGGETCYLNYLSKGLRDIKKSGKNLLSDSPSGRKRKKRCHNLNNLANLAESSQFDNLLSLSQQAISLFPNSMSEIQNLDYFVTILHVICGSNEYEKLSVVKNLRTKQNLDNAVSFLLNLVYYVVKLLPDYDSVILTLIEAIEALIANPSVDLSSKDAIKYAVKGLLLIIAHQNSVPEWNNHWIRYRACRTLTLLLSACHIRVNSLQYTLRFLRKTISCTMTIRKCFGIVSLCTALGPDALDQYIWPSLKSFLEMIKYEKTSGLSSGAENVNNIEIALTLAAVVMYKNFWSIDTLVTERHIIADSLLLDSLCERVAIFRSLAAINHRHLVNKKKGRKSKNSKLNRRRRNIFNPEVMELYYGWDQISSLGLPNCNKSDTKLIRWFDFPKKRNIATPSIIRFGGLQYKFCWTIPNIRKALDRARKRRKHFTYADGINKMRLTRHIPRMKLHALSCAGDLSVVI